MQQHHDPGQIPEHHRHAGNRKGRLRAGGFALFRTDQVDSVQKAARTAGRYAGFIYLSLHNFEEKNVFVIKK